jgi:hypothetical protein
MKRIGIVSTAVLFAIFGFTVLAHAQDQHDQDEKKQQEAKPEKQPKEEKAAKPEKQDGKQQDQHQNQGKAANEQQKNEDKPVKDQQKQEEKTQQQNQRQEQDSQKKQVEQEKAAQREQQNDKDQKRDDHRVNGQQPAQQANRPSPQPQHGNAGAQQSALQEHRASNWKSEHRDWQQRGGYHGYRIPDDRFRASFGEAHRFRIDSVPVTVVEGFPRFQINGFWFAMVDPWPEYWSNNWYDTDDVYIEYYDGGYYLNDPRYPGVRLAINVLVG